MLTRVHFYDTACTDPNCRDQGSGGYGQNLATWGSSGDISDLEIDAAAAGITMQWYNDEMENWQFYGEDNPPSTSSLEGWGHFTQVVWKSTTKVGCATELCPAGTIFSFESWYTVCNYDPAGKFFFSHWISKAKTNSENRQLRRRVRYQRAQAPGQDHGYRGYRLSSDLLNPSFSHIA